MPSAKPDPNEKTEKQRRIEELKKDTQQLELKRRELNKRLQEERVGYEKRAEEKLKVIDTLLTTKRPTPVKDDPFDFLET